MTNFIRLLAALAITAFVAVPANAQPVRIIGRSEAVEPSGFVIQWPLSGFEASFSGGIFAATIDDTGKNWLNVEIDGKTSALPLREGKQSYILYWGAAGRHTIKVTRRTGAMEGATEILQLQAKDLAPLAMPERRILVFGDSIASGYGVEGKDQSCTFTTATQNAAKAWPALLAQSFGADVQVIAADGRGLYRNYEGEAPTMGTLMWRALPDSGKWTGTFDPQLVVVNLGTNDFGEGDPGPGFDKAYERALLKLRTEFPNAQIVATIGGMLDAKMLAPAKASIEDAVKSVRSSGDQKTSFVFLNPSAKGKRYGCDWHPGVDAQAAMAKTLQTEASRALGWSAAGGK